MKQLVLLFTLICYIDCFTYLIKRDSNKMLFGSARNEF